MSNLLKNILFSALIVSATSSCLANPTATVDISQLPPTQIAADLQIFEVVNFNIMDCTNDSCGCDGGVFRKLYPLAELGLVDQMLFTNFEVLFQITNDLAMLSPDLISNGTELSRIILEVCNNMQFDPEFIELPNNIEKDPKSIALCAKIAAGGLSENESKI
ncbi:MAG TPA: hypothetical protein VJJ81_02120, partial [Candidatus Babeliales bacterium]|nr:hypothetical protein [Candidatus Babeliales bacterium]